MDLHPYRMREQQERALALKALSAEQRAAHLALAERYRAVIAAYEQVEQAAPPERRMQPRLQVGGS